VTLIREPDGRHYVSFVVDTSALNSEDDSGEHPEARTVAGVDVGLTDLATITRSDGTQEKITNPHWLRTRQRKLARAQRALARKQKGSNNKDKARYRVAVEHRKMRETRLDHHHKLALRLVRENQTVAVEGLSITGLTRTRLAKSIHDAGWATLLRLLREKALEHDRQVTVIDQWAPTTQTCAVCGARDGKKPLRVRVWQCQECLTWLDRDYNAAVNIMVAAGLAETLIACGGSIRRQLAVADPVKQEPTEQTQTDVWAA
jgi:putative transposase